VELPEGVRGKNYVSACNSGILYIFAKKKF
jgi:hypothetical protein